MMHRIDMQTTATTAASNQSHSNSGNIEEASSTSLLPERLQRLGSGVSVVLDPPEPGGEAESRKLPSSRYKGVVPQPNGRWGAQIYEKHQRVWLGTFNNEAEAARSYDVAAQRFRGRDAITNFKPLSLTDDADATVLVFLNSRSKSEIVDMLRKHTYNDELRQSRTSSAAALRRLKGGINHIRGIGTGVGNRIGYGSGRPAQEHLFDKVVTPSDVGKLNRLVIPKQHAEKHFPLQVGRSNIVACKGVLLNFEDPAKKVWRFRYSYWNSSQSYVLTKGWTRFVKEKGLKAGDVVTFQRSTGPDRTLHIDWRPRMVMAGGGGAPSPTQVVRLFGVNIVSSSSIAVCLNGEDGLSNNGRRNWRELELFPSPNYFHKKQCTGLDQFRENLI